MFCFLSFETIFALLSCAARLHCLIVSHELVGIVIGVEPFIALIEGGREGEFFHDLEGYFYYAQLKRSVCNLLPCLSVSDLFRVDCCVDDSRVTR